MGVVAWLWGRPVMGGGPRVGDVSGCHRLRTDGIKVLGLGKSRANMLSRG